MDGLPSLDAFRAAFGESPGVLPDGYVVGSRRSDWPAVLEALSAADQPATWVGGTARVLESELMGPEKDGDMFAVRPIPGVRINFFAGPEVLFDIDLREIVTAAAMKSVLGVIARIGLASSRLWRSHRKVTGTTW